MDGDKRKTVGEPTSDFGYIRFGLHHENHTRADYKQYLEIDRKIDEAFQLALDMLSPTPSKRKELLLLYMAEDEFLVELKRYQENLYFIQEEAALLEERMNMLLEKLKKDDSWWNPRGGPQLEPEKKEEIDKSIQELTDLKAKRDILMAKANEIKQNIEVKREELNQIRVERAQANLELMHEQLHIGIDELNRVLELNRKQPGLISESTQHDIEESVARAQQTEKRVKTLEPDLARYGIDTKAFDPAQNFSRTALTVEFQAVFLRGRAKQLGNITDMGVYQEFDQKAAKNAAIYDGKEQFKRGEIMQGKVALDAVVKNVRELDNQLPQFAHQLADCGNKRIAELVSSSHLEESTAKNREEGILKNEDVSRDTRRIQESPDSHVAEAHTDSASSHPDEPSSPTKNEEANKNKEESASETPPSIPGYGGND